MEYGSKEHIDKIIDEFRERLGFREKQPDNGFNFAIIGTGDIGRSHKFADIAVPYGKPSDTPLFMAYDPAVPDYLYLDFGRMSQLPDEPDYFDWRNKYGPTTCNELPDESLLELAFSPTGEAARLAWLYLLNVPGSKEAEAEERVSRFLTAYNASGLRNESVNIDDSFNDYLKSYQRLGKITARDLRDFAGKKVKFSSRIPIKLK